MKAFSSRMCHTARLLLTNKQGGHLAQLSITPDDTGSMLKTLGAIVIHAVVVLDSNSRQPALLPFVNMMTNPAALAVSRKPHANA